jgi:hypothetical protein
VVYKYYQNKLIVWAVNKTGAKALNKKYFMINPA